MQAAGSVWCLTCLWQHRSRCSQPTASHQGRRWLATFQTASHQAVLQSRSAQQQTPQLLPQKKEWHVPWLDVMKSSLQQRRQEARWSGGERATTICAQPNFQKLCEINNGMRSKQIKSHTQQNTLLPHTNHHVACMDIGCSRYCAYSVIVGSWCKSMVVEGLGKWDERHCWP